MKVVQGYPPNIEDIRAVFDPLPEGVVFAWGDTIYAPGGTVPLDLHIHEETHERQQAAMGGPEDWWALYLTDRAFRLRQEVEAYKNQIAFWPGRDMRRQAKRIYARDLVRLYRLYINEAEALRLLGGGGVTV